MHAEAPEELEYMPGAQSVQLGAPMEPAKVPAAQLKQLGIAPAEKLPNEQLAQAVPPGEYWPGEQLRQSLAWTEPAAES